MQTQLPRRKKNLLLVTSHLPHAEGSSAQRLAWRLMTIAEQTHQVYLVCRLDGGLRLDHWRQLARRTEKLAIIPERLSYGITRTQQEVDPWAAQHRFDAVLCDTTDLWPALDTINAKHRACVMRTNSWWRKVSGDTIPPGVLQLRGHESFDTLKAQLHADTAQPTYKLPAPESQPLAKAA